MTSEEMESEIGRAFIERRELTKKIECLEHRLRTVGKAATELADNPLYAEAEAVMESASDVRQDFKDLKAALQRLRELNRILS